MDNKRAGYSKKRTQTTKKTTRSKKTIKNKKPSLKSSELPVFKILIATSIILLVFVSLASSLYFLFNDFFERKELKPLIVEQNINKTKPVIPLVYPTNVNLTQKNTTILLAQQKPYLVIIIDDVMFKNQVQRIMNIPLKISPSFLPQELDNSNMSKYTKDTKFHLVHLPLEAENQKFIQNNTLLASDTYEEIYKKLLKLKKQFPNTIFYNNHTGSKFTANLNAMDRLFRAMDKLGLIFIDSRTTALTKASQIAQKYNQKLLQRDVFLDHEIDKNYIKQQIYLSINTAKQNGSAIAIGHPHEETLIVLKEMADIINKEVEVVYLEDLYYAKD